jgi:hypothetical protein
MQSRLLKALEKLDVFIICPVRNVDAETSRRIGLYVTKLEAQGKKVYWPARNTDQIDPMGMRIMKDNRNAMLKANEIHIWWDPTSDGSKADIGALIMLLFFKTKKVVLINKVESTPNKSFENLVLELSKNSLN